jgi:hypothetical protein
MKYHNYLIISLLALFSCDFSLENENDKKEHALRKEIEEKFAEDSLRIPNTFIRIEPSLDPIFINAFNQEAKEKEWEANLVGVLLTSEDWQEDIDKRTQQIKGRIRTATVLFKGEEGACFVFETYQIYQDYQNGEYLGEPRAHFHSPSKEVNCEKYKHLIINKLEPIEYDKKGE